MTLGLALLFDTKVCPHAISHWCCAVLCCGFEYNRSCIFVCQLMHVVFCGFLVWPAVEKLRYVRHLAMIDYVCFSGSLEVFVEKTIGISTSKWSENDPCFLEISVSGNVLFLWEGPRLRVDDAPPRVL
jgi:hypothetical protein